MYKNFYQSDKKLFSYKMPKGVSEDKKLHIQSLVIYEIDVGLRQLNNFSSHHAVNSEKVYT